jgi:Mce-associated membrane protein
MKAAQIPTQASASRRRIAGERTREPAPARPPVERRRAAQIRRRVVVPGWLLSGLAVMATAVLSVDAVAWARSGVGSGADADAAMDASALSAASTQAEKATEQILSYDYARLRQDTTAATPYMTTGYAQTFERTVRDLLASRAAAARGKVSARAMASGVISADDDAVKVLVFVDQTSTTEASPHPQTALNRVELTMVYQGGAWLVDDVTAL